MNFLKKKYLIGLMMDFFIILLLTGLLVTKKN